MPLYTSERSRGRLPASCGSSEPALGRPRSDDFRAFNHQVGEQEAAMKAELTSIRTYHTNMSARIKVPTTTMLYYTMLGYTLPLFNILYYNSEQS